MRKWQIYSVCFETTRVELSRNFMSNVATPIVSSHFEVFQYSRVTVEMLDEIVEVPCACRPSWRAIWSSDKASEDNACAVTLTAVVEDHDVWESSPLSVECGGSDSVLGGPLLDSSDNVATNCLSISSGKHMEHKFSLFWNWLAAMPSREGIVNFFHLRLFLVRTRLEPVPCLDQVPQVSPCPTHSSHCSNQ